AAIQSFDRDFIPRTELLERMSEMREALVEMNSRVVRSETSIDETFDRAWRMLRMRRVLVATGDGYAVLARQRELVSYYANSIAHLLGPFEAAVRQRDALPATSVAGIACPVGRPRARRAHTDRLHTHAHSRALMHAHARSCTLMHAHAPMHIRASSAPE